jgi:hypothetical protein
VSGLALPEMRMEVDIEAVIPEDDLSCTQSGDKEAA